MLPVIVIPHPENAERKRENVVEMARKKPCSVLGCSDRTSIRHNFPTVKKVGLEMVQRWIEICAEKKLLSAPPSELHKSYKVCHRHFERKFHLANNRLMRTAVPTLFLPTFNEEEANPLEIPKTDDKIPVAPPSVSIDHQYALPQQQPTKATKPTKPKEIDAPIIDFKVDVPYRCPSPIADDWVDDDDEYIEVNSINVCRLCLTNEHVTNITTEGFKTYDYDNLEEPNDVLGILKKYTHIEIADSTSKMMSVCASCHKMLQCIQLFANMCRKAEKCLNIIDKHTISLDMAPVKEPPELLEKSDALFNNLEMKYCNLVSINVALSLSEQETSLKSIPRSSLNLGDGTSMDITQSTITAPQPSVVAPVRPYIRPGFVRPQPVQVFDLCDVCGVTFTRTSYYVHKLGCDTAAEKAIKDADTLRLHQCSYCDQMFHLENTLRIHVLEQHATYMVICEMCGEEVAHRYLDRHIKTHSQRWLCYVCGEEITDRRAYNKHIRKHRLKAAAAANPTTVKKVKNCKVCKMPVIDLNQHRLQFHPKVKKWFKCGTCNILCSNMRSYEKHLKTHEEVVVHLCTMCGQGFEREGLLNLHLLTHGITKKYSCHVCKEEYEDYKLLLEHKEVHRTFACTLCDMKFFGEVKLAMHLELQHYQNFKCDTCGKCFRLKRLLEEHVPVHSGIYPFKCHICDKGFSFVQSVNAHIMKEHNDGLQCKQCGKVCISKTAYYKHQMSHAGLKPFVCKICMKGFGSQLILTEHKLTHTGQTTYNCPRCGVDIVHKRTLQLHLRKCGMPRNVRRREALQSLSNRKKESLK